jgi:hypothetical protein
VLHAQVEVQDLDVQIWQDKLSKTKS